MKKRLLCLAMTLILLIAATACGSSGGSPMEVADSAASSADTGWTETAKQDAASGTNGALSAVRANAKLILRAELMLESQEFDKTSESIDALTAQYGGYFEQNGVSGDVGNRYADYTVRVPQAKFEEFLSAVGEQCHVVSKSQSAEDIADQYTDVETRLATLRTKHERLLALLDKAATMEDIISLETALSDTEYQIESLTGQLRSYDSLVDFATVQLSVREVQALSATAEGNSFGAQVRQAAASGLNGLTAFCRGLVLTVVTIWPLLLVLGGAGVAAWQILKYRRRKQAEQDTALQEKNPDEK